MFSVNSATCRRARQTSLCLSMHKSPQNPSSSSSSCFSPKFRLFWCLFASITGSWRHPLFQSKDSLGQPVAVFPSAWAEPWLIRAICVASFEPGKKFSRGRDQSYSDFKERPQTSVCCSSSCELSTPAFRHAALFYFFSTRVRRSTASTPPRSFFFFLSPRMFFWGADRERNTRPILLDLWLRKICIPALRANMW